MPGVTQAAFLLMPPLHPVPSSLSRSKSVVLPLSSCSVLQHGIWGCSSSPHHEDWQCTWSAGADETCFCSARISKHALSLAIQDAGRAWSISRVILGGR